MVNGHIEELVSGRELDRGGPRKPLKLKDVARRLSAQILTRGTPTVRRYHKAWKIHGKTEIGQNRQYQEDRARIQRPEGKPLKRPQRDIPLAGQFQFRDGGNEIRKASKAKGTSRGRGQLEVVPLGGQRDPQGFFYRRMSGGDHPLKKDIKVDHGQEKVELKELAPTSQKVIRIKKDWPGHYH